MTSCCDFPLPSLPVVPFRFSLRLQHFLVKFEGWGVGGLKLAVICFCVNFPCLHWVRNRAGENRPGDIRPNHFVYTCVSTRVSTHVSTRVGAFVWVVTQRKPTFVGTLVYTRVSTRVSTCGSPFVGALVGHISLSPALCFTDSL